MMKFFSVLLIFLSLPTVAQESVLKDFAESRRDLKFCLYPSTLRMINIQKDPEFNELVSGVEKLLIYTLDSATIASKSYTNWTNEYRELGYEEYISMTGSMNLVILGKKEEFVGLTGAKGNVAAFYLRGKVAFEKIPKLVQTFETGDYLSSIINHFER